MNLITHLCSKRIDKNIPILLSASSTICIPSSRVPHGKTILYRVVERSYLNSVDSFIFNSNTTCDAVQALIGEQKPFIVANPPTDRFGSRLNENLIRDEPMRSNPLRLLFLGNVIPLKGLHVLLEALRDPSF